MFRQHDFIRVKEIVVENDYWLNGYYNYFNSIGVHGWFLEIVVHEWFLGDVMIAI